MSTSSNSPAGGRVALAERVPPPTPPLALERVGVDFGATRALHDVSLAFAPGEIVGLLGHNGAGKSTLFNVVSGALRATAGSIRVAGEEVGPRPTPREMADCGIAVIHQEPALAHNLSVLDNIFLGQEHLIERGRGEAQARAALARVGADLELHEAVATLGLGERQLVDLARGIVRGDMRVLLLDEPTAALGRAETDALHALIRQLAADGVAVIYVSHRLPDILDVCERIVILRAGRVQEDGPASLYDGAALARALAPELAEDAGTARRSSSPVRATLELSGIFTGVTVGEGEVLGLFGMAAGRQFEILESLFGLHGRYRFTLDGTEIVVTSPSAAVARGVHLVPGDRERDGLITGQRAIDTVFLPWYSRMRGRGAWIGGRTGEAEYAAARADFQVVGPVGSAPIDEFSGGNRQKHLIARWASVRRPRLLLLAQPTQGVDVGARKDIARAVHAIAQQGTTVLVASSESDEIDLLCDRAVVIADTHFTTIERGEDFSGALLASLLGLAERQAKGTVS
ncbi:ATP-binding cassette domain-containing protein [Microbacterium sp. YJN-G]|uniref:ATP-binding cassette domain-containing protein n=1 Tax=Microbacterium sp. YJN-G TaxID=2763257 RepID=UPI0018777079|nr:sugar ABC transporter ATP-binding protein [Microbacterium sp. YJN-G]